MERWQGAVHNSSDQTIEIDHKNRLFRVFTTLSKHEDLAPGEAEFAAKVILDGLTNNRFDISDLLIAFFGALTIKDPTLNELTEMAAAMEATKKFRFQFHANKPLVTAGGTGGDTVPTINVTTPAVIAAAAAGSYALKSGARAFSSKTGSSDLADCLGINVNASRDVVESCVEKIRTTVWASEGVYPWMKPLIELGRRESVATTMPLLYSLRLMIATALNPFSVKRQVRGVSKPFTEKVATVLRNCGYERALVVLGHGRSEEVRIDEFSCAGKSIVSELKVNGSIDTYTVSPEDVGLRTGKIEDVVARSSHIENAQIALGVLSGSDRTLRRDLILLNAASIIYTADDVKTLKDGFELICQSVDEGKALEELRRLVALSGGRKENLESIERSLKSGLT
jgi:anthranilate phosphoribosyltransferase